MTTKLNFEIERVNELMGKKVLDHDETLELYDILKELEAGENEDEILKISNKINFNILNSEERNVKSFTFSSGRLYVSDPSYDFEEPGNDDKIKASFLLGNIGHQAKNGNWKGFYKTWLADPRPNIMVVHHEDYDFIILFESDEVQIIHNAGSFGIDSGTFVACDEKAFKDTVQSKEWQDQWMKMDRHFGFESGYCCSTGWGDGFYEYDLFKDQDGNVVGLMAWFIY